MRRIPVAAFLADRSGPFPTALVSTSACI